MKPLIIVLNTYKKELLCLYNLKENYLVLTTDSRYYPSSLGF